MGRLVIVSAPKRRMLAKRFRGRGTGLLASLRGTSLGDDTLDATKAWQEQMLAETKGQSEWLERWVKRDELQRWLQIAATLAIPLSAAIWRAIFRGARGE